MSRGRRKGCKNRKPQHRQEMQRHSLARLGIDEVRYKELRNGCRAGIHSRETLLQACAGFEFLKPWILLSVEKGLSYDRLELYRWAERPPIGRTSFNGYKNLFYRNLNNILLKRQEEVVCRNTDSP